MPRTSGSFTLGDLRAGRKKGSRDKLGRDFFQALSEDFAEHGAGVIKIVRFEDPGLYLKIVASTMPKEFTVERVTSELTDDELEEMIVRQREQIAKTRASPRSREFPLGLLERDGRARVLLSTPARKYLQPRECLRRGGLSNPAPAILIGGGVRFSFPRLLANPAHSVLGGFRHSRASVFVKGGA